MVSRASLEVLQILTTLCGPVLRIFPLKFCGLGKVESFCSNHKYENFWIQSTFCFTAITCLEFYWNLKFQFDKDFTDISFHFVMSLFKLALTSYLYTLQVNADSIALILNCIIKHSDFAKNKDISERILSLLVTVTFAFIVTCGIPILGFVFHERLHSFYDNLSGAPLTQNSYWKIAMLVMNAVEFTPIGIAGANMGCILLITLDHAQLTLRSLNVSMNKVKRTRNIAEDRFTIGMTYRKALIFNMLCNEVFKNCFWIAMQFVSATSLISMFYCLVVYQGKLSKWMKAFFMLCCWATVVYNVAAYHFGSNPEVLSGRFLQLTRSNWGGCGWSRRFFRSCPVIAARVGDFHKIDRERGPAFFRFVLQRTAYFVSNAGSNFQILV